MQFARRLLRWNSEDQEFYQNTSRRVILTTLFTYFCWHIIATLGWPGTFSPSLWLITMTMLAATLLSLAVMRRFFISGVVLWFLGLLAALLLSYRLYERPEILLLSALLPMFAEVMVGLRGTFLMDAGLITLFLSWGRLTGLPPLPEDYPTYLSLLTLAATVLGWGLSDNLISSMDAASYHYREAVQRLEEVREHRAEISKLLSEVNKANYQLDRLNRMLEYARAQAEEARVERDRFALAISHELRSPLNFIIGFSDLMVNSPETYAELKRWPKGLYEDIREIFNSSTHLMGLINDVLDMGKIDARQMELFREKLSIQEVFEEIEIMNRVAVEKKGLKLSVQVEAGLPPLFVDRTRVRQVLLNLVTNALRFTSRGGISLRASRKNQEMVLVEVVDTGTGISEEDAAKVFTEFRQAGQPNWQRTEGTGLGLSIARRFIELHGGEIGVHSHQGQGSTFFFTLPFHQALDDVRIIGAGPAGAHPLPQLDEKFPLLLILARDPLAASFFSEQVKQYNLTILTEPDQLAGTVRQMYPRAVIVDAALAELAAVRAFLANPPYILPVLTLPMPDRSGGGQPLPEGVLEYLVKPVTREQLGEVVQKLGRGVESILVVDDDPAMARFVTQAVQTAHGENGSGRQRREINFLTANSGLEAINLLKSARIDAILLDLDLGDINGLTLLNQLQRDERLKQIPVVIVSAFDLPPTLPAQGYSRFNLDIQRPFSRSEVIELVNATLHGLSTNYSPLLEEKAKKAEPTPGQIEPRIEPQAK